MKKPYYYLAREEKTLILPIDGKADEVISHLTDLPGVGVASYDESNQSLYIEYFPSNIDFDELYAVAERRATPLGSLYLSQKLTNQFGFTDEWAFETASHYESNMYRLRIRKPFTAEDSEVVRQMRNKIYRQGMKRLLKAK